MMTNEAAGRTGPATGHGDGPSPSQGPDIWARRERSSRGPSPEHSRPEIAAAGVALADASGLAAVTMRSVAGAIGTGAASLYRYVATRDELIEVMADLVYGELGYDEPASGQPVTDLLRLARQGRAMYLRHPWLLDIPGSRSLPGPNALTFIEHVLAVLAGTGLDGPARLETVGLFSGAVRLAAQSERDQRAAGQDAAQWQAALAGYLLRIAAAGSHPHLAAALADPPGGDGTDAGQMPLFDRIIIRIINGLLPQLPPEGPPDSL